MKTRLGAPLVVVSTLLGVCVIAGPALAASYNVHAWGTLQTGSNAKAYGKVYNNSYVQIEDASYQYQIENGDNGAYVSSTYSYYESGGDCGYDSNYNPKTCWYQPSTNYQTKRTTSHSWVWGATYEAFRPNGTSARAVVKVCEDISWWPDSCSGTAIMTFPY